MNDDACQFRLGACEASVSLVGKLLAEDLVGASKARARALWQAHHIAGLSYIVLEAVCMPVCMLNWSCGYSNLWLDRKMAL